MINHSYDYLSFHHVLCYISGMPTLNWIGKEKVVNHWRDVPYRILNRTYSFDSEGQHKENNDSENMIIHGDNLDALKALLPNYTGRINCIYIDPPYNTAHSTNNSRRWVYNDNVDDPLMKKWLGKVVGDESEDLSRHDKWLCMMYPRLTLLQKLLSTRGIIFISIDDNETANLRCICDEIFGKNNFLENFIWYVDGHTDNQDVITGVHEYILCYAKNKNMLTINSVIDPNVPLDSKIRNKHAENSITKNGEKNPVSIITLPIDFPCEIKEYKRKKTDNIEVFLEEVKKTGYITREITKKYDMKYPVLFDDINVKNYKLQYPCRVYSGWMNADKLRNFIDNKCQPLEDDGTELKFYLSKNGVIYYYRGNRKSHYVQSILENMGTTETNKYMLERIGLKFDYPKPVELITFLINLFTDKNDIVLDSFAGSGTTAHAVLNLNKADGGNRKFILIETMDYAESITAERVKRVINGYSDTKGTGGGFSYYELGEPLLDKDDNLNHNIDVQKIREYVSYTETGAALEPVDSQNRYYLGTNYDTSYYFYYEKGQTTSLSFDFLCSIKKKSENYVIYADKCTLSTAELEKYHIVFKKIPRDIARL